MGQNKTAFCFLFTFFIFVYLPVTSLLACVCPSPPGLHNPSHPIPSCPPVQVGNHIDVQSQKWVAQDAGIGAGVDSYFEYLVKGAIMLQDEELLNMFLGNCSDASVSRSLSRARRCTQTPTVASAGEGVNALCAFGRVRPGHPELHPLRRLVPVGADAQRHRVHAGVPVPGGLLAWTAGGKEARGEQNFHTALSVPV